MFESFYNFMTFGQFCLFLGFLVLFGILWRRKKGETKFLGLKKTFMIYVFF